MGVPLSTAEPRAIVVGFDYSDSSDATLERAFGAAVSDRPTRLHVVHAEATHPSVLGGDLSSAENEALVQASAHLREHIERFARHWCEAHPCPVSFKRVTTHVRLGPAAEAIVQLAVDLGADLIVVGTHGRRGARRFLMGSVADATVRLASCDVLVVRTGEAALPQIEAACPACVEVRQSTNGSELWCAQHREHHERRHAYHFSPLTPSHQSSFLIHAE